MKTISHSQWICRNITLHDKLRGTLFLRKREDVLKELDSLIDTDPEEIPAERRFLLEFDFDSLFRSSFENQTYYGKQKSVPPLNAREKGHENNKV